MTSGMAVWLDDPAKHLLPPKPHSIPVGPIPTVTIMYPQLDRRVRISASDRITVRFWPATTWLST